MKVAIVQDFIGGGGRFSVLLEIINKFNEEGVIPDVICYKFGFQLGEIEKQYGSDVKFHLKKIKSLYTSKLPEFSRLYFNYKATRILRNKYDLVVNGNNTSCLLSPETALISYIHYPRKDRLFRKNDLHAPDFKPAIKTRIAHFLDKILAGFFYTTERKKTTEIVIANSNFTKNAILRNYKLVPDAVNVIYPPINISVENSTNKNNWVASIGSFSIYKNQLQQLKIAKRVPTLTFNIMGFANVNSIYFKKCQKYIKKNNLNNVILYPNIEYQDMLNILKQSKYFLHTLINEPFGIATVQGIMSNCIPVVPNSGGQKEVVPMEKLRFDCIDKAVEILNNNYYNDNTLLSSLISHIKNYSSENFRKQFWQLVLVKSLND